METNKSSMSPGKRLRTGAAILAAAQAVDTKLIAARLSQFATVHRRYAGAQQKAEALEALRQKTLARRDAEQDEAVEVVARALVAAGRPRTRPFSGFSTTTPTLIKRLTGADKTVAIYQLIADLRRATGLSPQTLTAVNAADKTAHAAEAATVTIDRLEVSLRNARHKRDALAPSWDAALGALRRRTRAAADDGAPGLYPALFGSPARTRKTGKAPKPPVAPAPATPPVAPQVPTPPAAT